MRFNLLVIFFFISIISFGQLSPISGGRIDNNTTAFGVNISKGAVVVDASTNKLYICITAALSTETLTTGWAKFKWIPNAKSQNIIFVSKHDSNADFKQISSALAFADSGNVIIVDALEDSDVAYSNFTMARSGVTIVGLGEVHYDRATNSLKGHGARIKSGVYINANYCTLDNLGFYYNANRNCLGITGSHIDVRNCVMVGPESYTSTNSVHGFNFEPGWYLTLSNCKSYNVYHGFVIKGSNVNMSDCYAEDNQGEGLIIKGGEGAGTITHDVNVSNFIARSPGTATTQHGVYLYSNTSTACKLYNVNLTNITVKNVTGSGVQISADAGASVKNINITNLIVDTAVYGLRIDTATAGTVDNINILNAIFKNYSSYGYSNATLGSNNIRMFQYSGTTSGTFITPEPAITAGTTGQYWRGDKSWQTLPTYTSSQWTEDLTSNRHWLYPTASTDSVGIGKTPTVRFDVNGTVKGALAGGTGVYGSGQYGVYGSGTVYSIFGNATGNDAIYGASSTGSGVRGVSTYGWGGYFDRKAYVKHKLAINTLTDTTYRLTVNGSAKIDTLLITTKILGTSDTALIREGNIVKYRLLSGLGGGTVTSISQGTGMLNSANPITTTGTVGVDTTKVVMFNDTIGAGGTGKIETKYHSTITFAPIASPVFAGTITIPVTTSSVTGVIYKSTNSFIHNFKGSGDIGSNTFVGIKSGNFTMNHTGPSTEASRNTGIGDSTLTATTTGYNNFAGGFASLFANTTGYNNTSIGYGAMYTTSTGYRNTAIGSSALYSNQDGYDNTAIGAGALYTNTSGNRNMSVGYNSSYLNTSGYLNTAFGYTALYSNTTGYYNTAVGYQSLYNNAEGYHNVAIGTTSGKFIANGSSPNTTPKNSIFIGRKSMALNATDSNQIVIGYSAIGNGCNTVTIGASTIVGTYLQGNVTAPQFTSSITTGTSPYTCTSTTVNTNLNADMVDGKHSTDLILKADSNKTAAGNYVTRKRLDSVAALKAAVAQTMYIGTTSTAINRGSAAQTLAGITLTTPEIGAATGTYIKVPTIPGTDLTATGLLETDTANVNMGLGDVVFIGGTNSDRMVLCKADAIANCPYAYAICTATVTAGNVGTYLTHGDLRNDAWTWTKGGQIYVSTTGTTTNTLTQSAPSGANNVILCVGVAKTAKVIHFEPNYIPIEHN